MLSTFYSDVLRNYGQQFPRTFKNSHPPFFASVEIQPKVRNLNELPLKTPTYTNRPLSSSRALIGQLPLLPQ